MDATVVDEIRRVLETSPASWRSVSGGDVSEAYDTTLGDGRRVFVKTHANPPDDFFTTEASGLDWLRESDAVLVPSVLAVGDDPAFLVLEWIDEGDPRPDTEAALGRALAAMHRSGAATFGREDRRTTGSRGLPNEPCDTWVEFYATQRLIPLARMARDQGALEASTVRAIDRVSDRLGDLGGDPEPPARLHGDLWSGNRLVDVAGQSWLIDPAAHGGHREFDLAMMRLFGGFGDACFADYAATFPLAEGSAERVPLHQLAPLIVHAVKFGGGYVAAVERALGQLL
ncbi:fructosamine kinase family protein [Actinospongicola halichondriae]|uniref:fructosamine kinase family protein n=1 Tax=Actinospongicola halichondriae TaxID=3236844 RepID=UPI003D594ABF